MKAPLLVLIASSVVSLVACQRNAAPADAVTNSVGIRMVPVQGGTFRMGASTGGNIDEGPAHGVTVSSFYIGATEVTQAQYRIVTGTNPASGYGVGDTYPVYDMSWYDAAAFCNALSDREGLQRAYKIDGTTVTLNGGANGYRLPTEAEWEYAARGGNRSLGYVYAGGNVPDAVGWYTGGYTGGLGDTTHPVGQKTANELGLYDMSGNVWEWCWDWWGAYSAGAQTDPLGPAAGELRVCRGGSWINDAMRLRTTLRVGNRPNSGDYDRCIGFRVVRSL